MKKHSSQNTLLSPTTGTSKQQTANSKQKLEADNGNVVMWITDDQTLDDLSNASSDLAIGSLYFVNVDFVDSILQRLQAFRGRSLKKIVIQSCRGKVHAAISFFLLAMRVKEFVVNEMQLDEACAEALGESLCATTELQCLHLQQVVSSSQLVEALHYGLVRCPSLEHLVFNTYVSTSPGNSGAALNKFFAETIPKIANLKRLEVCSYKKEERALALLLRTIHIHPSLLHLKVSIQSLEPSILASIDLLSRCCQSKLEVLELSIHNSLDNLHKLPSKSHFVCFMDPVISNDEMHYLGKTIANNPRIVSLDLSHKGLEDEGAVALALWLGKTTTLKQLHIQGNPVYTTGGHALLSAMKTNVSIEDIRIPDGCGICADQIHYFADLNKAGRKLLTDEEFPLSLWPLVMERATKTEFKPSGLKSGMNERRANALYSLLHGPAGFHTAYCKTKFVL